MFREQIVDFLRNYIPSFAWEYFWWMPSLIGIISLPAGFLFFQLLEVIGIYEPRGMQLLFLSSVILGIGAGITTLLLIEKAELPTTVLRMAKWLARLSIVAPLLFLSILFWIFSRP